MARAPRRKPTSPYTIIGQTFDGIDLLKPVTTPTSFTSAEIRKTIRDVMREQSIVAPAVDPEDPKADMVIDVRSTTKQAKRLRGNRGAFSEKHAL